MKSKIGENIRRLRKQKGLMQEQLADALGVSVAAVSRWERGTSIPELPYILDLADIFGVSLDALVGYRVQGTSAEDVVRRITELQNEQDYRAAAEEAEKALLRYPDDFNVVYTAGRMYALHGAETEDPVPMERAIALLRRAIPLLPQNQNPDVTAFSIQSNIAQCYFIQGDEDSGMEILKAENAGGVHNALIGTTYAVSKKHGPEEAMPYLKNSFYNCFTALIRTMIGYANCYVRQKDEENAVRALSWLIAYLESLKVHEEKACYADKLQAMLYAKTANLLDKLGRDPEEALEKALHLARKFDADPENTVKGLAFLEDSTDYVYDDVGGSVMDGIEQQIRKAHWSKALHSRWDALKNAQ